MGEKRYFWMKFQRDFFTSLRIKKLRRLAGGDTYTIIYLKLQLLSIVSEGYLQFKHVLETFEEEMAEEIDEDVENVQVTISYLLACGLMVQDEDAYFLPYAAENIGSDTASALRSKEYRKNLTDEQREKERERARIGMQKVREERKLQPCYERVTNVDIEKEIEKDKDIKRQRAKFVPPTLEEVQAYCKERGNKVDAKAFYDFFTTGNWTDSKGNKVKNWKQKVITWEKFEPKSKPKKENQFNTMIHNDYDFDDIERMVLGKQ